MSFTPKNPFKPRRYCGFTLVEMLAVITLIIVLAALVLASNQNTTAQAREVVYDQQRMQLQSALETWVASRENMATAIANWNADTSVQAVLSRAASMLNFSSRANFRVENGRIVSDASLARDIAFNVTWGSTDAEKLTQGPIVSLVTIPDVIVPPPS